MPRDWESWLRTATRPAPADQDAERDRTVNDQDEALKELAMPNGNDRNFVRFGLTIARFRAKHGHWPTRVAAVRPMTTESVRALFLPDSFARVDTRLELVDKADLDGQYWDGYFYAEDSDGNRVTYGDRVEPSPNWRREVCDWLALLAHPDAPHDGQD